jgi:hypothetical protein
MLSISPRHMNSLAADQLIRLLARIDSWLAETSPQWAAMALDRRRNELSDIERNSRDYGVESENDLAVLCWLCLIVIKDWRSGLSEPATRDVMTDQQWDIQCKLMHLEQAFRAKGG